MSFNQLKIIFTSGLIIFSTLIVLAQTSPLPCLNRTFTIVAHVVDKPDLTPSHEQADILAAVENLNSFFEPICTSFEVCEFRCVENYQYDSLERVILEWNELVNTNHVDNRINIFFMSAIDEDVAGFSAGSIGNLTSGGIAIAGIGSLVHEMGHFFGLSHTFGELGNDDMITLELVDGSNSESSGDLIVDTPADPFDPNDTITTYVDPSLCRFIAPLVDANGEYYIPHIGNIMTYLSCSGCEFTHDQFRRMAQSYLDAPQKMW